MRKTEAKYGSEARDKLFFGVQKVFDAVSHTMGARGRNVIYKKWGMPIVTNDGISIAREILPEDPYEYLGAESIKQASEQTNYDAGDGTSGTIVLAYHMLKNGLLQLDAGINPMILRKQMEIAKDKLIAELKNRAVEVTDLKEVAMVSVEDEKLADLVSKVVQEVGKDGSVLVDEYNGTDIKAETMRGYAWPKGYVSPYMVTNQRGEAELEDVAVIVTDKKLSLNSELIKPVNELLQKGIKNLLVVSDEFDSELLASAIVNKQKSVINIVAVKRPATMAELEDIATVTGATVVSVEKGMREIELAHIGHAKKIVASKERTIIVGDDLHSEKIEERVMEIRMAIASEDDQKYGDVEVLKQRLARLAGGIATIRVGGLTDAERTYQKLKVDDAVGACLSALQEGIVAGGGTTLRDIREVLDTNIPGERVIYDAMIKPYEQILTNAGFDVRATGIASNWNVLTGEVVGDMMKEGIVDPAKVLRCEIENAVSISKTLLTTECAIVDLPDEKKKD